MEHQWSSYLEGRVRRKAVNVRPIWSMWQVPGKPWPHNETVSTSKRRGKKKRGRCQRQRHRETHKMRHRDRESGWEKNCVIASSHTHPILVHLTWTCGRDWKSASSSFYTVTPGGLYCLWQDGELCSRWNFLVTENCFTSRSEQYTGIPRVCVLILLLCWICKMQREVSANMTY